MATTKTNGVIFAGIVVLSATAVLLQWREIDMLKLQKASLQAAIVQSPREQMADRQMLARRGVEIAALRNAKAAADLAAANPKRDFGQSAGYRNTVLRLRGQMTLDYAALFRRLHLAPQQQATLEEHLLARRMMEQSVASYFNSGAFPGIDHWDMDSLKALVTAGCAEIDGQIRQDLGPDGFEAYQQYSATPDYRSQVNGLVGQLQHTAVPLTDDQADRMVALLAKDQADTQPLPDSFAADAAAIMGSGQERALKTFVAATAARQTILAANRQALAEDKIPNPGPSALVLNLQP